MPADVDCFYVFRLKGPEVIMNSQTPVDNKYHQDRPDGYCGQREQLLERWYGRWLKAFRPQIAPSAID